MIPQPLHLFAPEWFEPVNTRTQVDRMPGTVNAPCLCERAVYDQHGDVLYERPCVWPFCKPSEKEDE